MNKILLIVALLFGAASCEVEEHPYSGTVVDKFRTDAGYKVSPQPHIVFYCDSLKRNIDVKTTWNCYVNLKVGDRVTFELTEWQLND